MEIPFNEWTEDYKAFMTLSDLKWHCAKCEFSSTQPAKNFQNIRNKWYEMEKSWAHFEKRSYCEKCKRVTSHRKLVSLVRNENNSVDRTKTFNPKLKERIIKLFWWIDAFLDYKPSWRVIQVDHRIPQVRWTEKEEDYINMSDEMLKEKFMLLVIEHNLLKSRNCERCKRINERQSFLWIDYFYEWWKKYDEKLWCVGCGWFNPEKWRRKLNKKLSWK